MPAQFESREQSAVGPSDLWFSFWIGVLVAGIGVFLLVDSTVGIAVAVVGALGWTGLAWKRGVVALPDGGGTLP